MCFFISIWWGFISKNVVQNCRIYVKHENSCNLICICKEKSVSEVDELFSIHSKHHKALNSQCIYSQLTNINYLRSSIILFPFITFSFFLRTFFLQCGYVCVCVCVYVRYVSMQHLIYYHNIDSNKWFYLKNWGYLYETHLFYMKKRIFMQIHTHTRMHTHTQSWSDKKVSNACKKKKQTKYVIKTQVRSVLSYENNL